MSGLHDGKFEQARPQVSALQSSFRVSPAQDAIASRKRDILEGPAQGMLRKDGDTTPKRSTYHARREEVGRLGDVQVAEGGRGGCVWLVVQYVLVVLVVQWGQVVRGEQRQRGLQRRRHRQGPGAAAAGLRRPPTRPHRAERQVRLKIRRGRGTGPWDRRGPQNPNLFYKLP